MPEPTAAAKVTRSRPPPGTVAATVAVPVTPAAGAVSVIDGAAAGAASSAPAL